MSDPYAYWKARQAGEKPKMFVDQPELGFYRMGVYEKEQNKARKRVGWQPVAIFQLGDDLTAVIGPGRRAKAETDRDKLNELWSYIAANDISEETYRAVAERGEPWPDSHETAPSIPMANSSMAIPGIVLTKEEVADAESEGITLQEKALRKNPHDIDMKLLDGILKIGLYKIIESDEQSSQARSLQQYFLDLRGEVIKRYEEQNRPLLNKQKELRAVWFPLRDRAEEASETLRKAMGAWEDTKRKAAKIAAERAEARQTPVQSNLPPPASQIRGGAGRAAAVRVEKFVVSIDIDKVFEQFRADLELRDVLIMLAQKAIRSGIDVPGATFEERSIVR